jgi:hypothetical protein
LGLLGAGLASALMPHLLPGIRCLEEAAYDAR